MKIKRLFEKNYWTIHYNDEYENRIGNVHYDSRIVQNLYPLTEFSFRKKYRRYNEIRKGDFDYGK